MSDSVQIDDAELVRRLSNALEYQSAETRRWMELYSSLRDPRHHDVLCLVLREYVRLNGKPGERDEAMITLVMLARQAADLAYPPPKAEGA